MTVPRLQNPVTGKRKANFCRFEKLFRSCYRDRKVQKDYVRSQFDLLVKGVRDVRISDNGCYAWPAAGGEW